MTPPPPHGGSLHHYLRKPSGDDYKSLQECGWLGWTTNRAFRLHVGRLLLRGSPDYRNVRGTSFGWSFASMFWGLFVPSCVIASCGRSRNRLVYRVLLMTDERYLTSPVGHELASTRLVGSLFAYRMEAGQVFLRALNIATFLLPFLRPRRCFRSAAYFAYIRVGSNTATAIVLIVGSIIFAMMFAVNSSVHSYLIVSYSNKV